MDIKFKNSEQDDIKFDPTAKETEGYIPEPLPIEERAILIKDGFGIETEVRLDDYYKEVAQIDNQIAELQAMKDKAQIKVDVIKKELGIQ